MARKRTVGKKTAKRPVKNRAKRVASGQKRTSAVAATPSKPPREMSFFNHFLKIFAPPETGKRNGR